MTTEDRPVSTERLPKIEGYEVIRRIGTGGYSAVYEAIQEDVRAPVALKVLEVAYDGRARTRFERECQSMGRLREERGIVPVYSATYTTDGRPVIVMSLFSGGSLDDQLNASGPISVDDMLGVARDIGAALTSAHHAGIYHRDIKPENILLDRFGRSALTDFGIATMAGEINSTETYSSLTPAHAPPERYLSDQRLADPIRGDIYSLASTLHTMLTGRAPHGSARDGGLAALIQRILNEDPPPINRDDVPDHIRHALTRAMAKQPDERFASAAEFLAAIDIDRSTAPTSPTRTSERRVGSEGTGLAPTPGLDESLEDLERTRRRPAPRRSGEPEMTPPPVPNAERRLESDDQGHGFDDAKSDSLPDGPRSRRRVAFIACAAAVAVGIFGIVVSAANSSEGPTCLTGPGVDQQRAIEHGSVVQSDQDRFYWKLGDREGAPVFPISLKVGVVLAARSKDPVVKDQASVTAGTANLERGVLLRRVGSSRVWRIDEGSNKQVVSNACADDVYRVPNVGGVLDQLPLREDR